MKTIPVSSVIECCFFNNYLSEYSVNTEQNTPLYIDNHYKKIILDFEVMR